MDHEGSCIQILKYRKNFQRTLSQPRTKHGNLLGQGSLLIIFGARMKTWFMKDHSFLIISVDSLYTLLSSILCNHSAVSNFYHPYRVILSICKNDPYFFAKKCLKFVVMIIKILNGLLKVAITKSYVSVHKLAAMFCNFKIFHDFRLASIFIERQSKNGFSNQVVQIIHVIDGKTKAFIYRRVFLLQLNKVRFGDHLLGNMFFNSLLIIF